jgi:hypothetical protein
MAYLKYEDGKKEFVPMIITVECEASLNALLSVVHKAHTAAPEVGVIRSCAAEMITAINCHAKEHSIKLTVTV